MEADTVARIYGPWVAATELFGIRSVFPIHLQLMTTCPLRPDEIVRPSYGEFSF